MKLTAIAAVALVLAACKSADITPDPSLFPDKSEDWKAGFRKGFQEGIVYNIYSQQVTP